MKNLIKISTLLILMLFACNNRATEQMEERTASETPAVEESASVESFSILSEDSLMLQADFYKVAESTKPLILLFHQAQFSRGEYLEIAPQLNALGFSCLAIDQRSGKKINGIDNSANIQALKKGLATDYVDALPDLQATLNYALAEGLSDEVILWGSSYSASLIFILASQNPASIVGLVSFSPGEYFTYEGKEIKEFAAETKSPVFITSEREEEKYWREIYAQISSEKIAFLPSFAGYHGSKALWEVHEGNEEYWEALEAFLARY